MALTNLYIGITPGQMSSIDPDDGNMNTGSSSTSTDWFEIRIMTNDGTNATNVTRRDALLALDKIKNALVHGKIAATYFPLL